MGGVNDVWGYPVIECGYAQLGREVFEWGRSLS